MPEEVFDRPSQRPGQIGRGRRGRRFLRPLPRPQEGEHGLLWYLGDHLSGFDVDGVSTWAASFVVFALPRVASVEFTCGPDTETVDVLRHVPSTGPDDPRWSRPAWFRTPPAG